MKNQQHSSVTNEHYTPKFIVEAARAAMGSIDLDPASCDIANTVVGAENYYTIDDDGLSKEWLGNVFLNPPGGRGSAKKWWAKLMKERWDKFIFVGFSIEILQTTQGLVCVQPYHYHLCFPSKRIAFLNENLEPQTSPTHANVIIGGGMTRDIFEKSFRHIGACKT